MAPVQTGTGYLKLEAPPPLSDDGVNAAFGLWKNRPDIIQDGLEYQLAIRAEWDHRPQEPVRAPAFSTAIS